jgi:hypothetical protein
MRQVFLVKLSISVLLASLLFCSCKKDETTDKPATPAPTPAPTPITSYGNLKIQFTNYVDDQTFVLGTSFQNPAGEAFTATKFNYYISNVVLTKSDNSTLVVKDVYRIVKQDDDTSRLITLRNIPSGNYKSIKLMLGIDSASNNSGAHSGGLDFDYASDMFWGWNQGYIFLKLEGSASSSTLTNNKIEYHIGGYGGVNKTQKNYELSFGSSQAQVTSSTTPVVSLKVNVNEMFKTPVSLSFVTKPQQTSIGTGAKMIADNYADMILFDKVVN